ncbi:MAG TPA: hypothetical protein VE891_01065 [Allosphingosinicella sp.]|nr:hypothetical protein [Allosphingosinicella sp.]
MRLRLAPLLLAPLLASCQPPEIAARAVFYGDALAFIAADPGDSDEVGCWDAGTVVDDSLRPVWRFSGPGRGECGKLFPLFYGRAPEGAETAIEATRLEPGRLYLFIGDSTAGISGAFAFTQAGNTRIVHDIDPDSPAADLVRQRWWAREVPAIASAAPPSATEGGR